MKAYFQDEWTTIYLGDCREILPELPKVDLVLTDPPYPNDKRFNGSWELIHEVAGLCYKLSAENSWLISDIFRANVAEYIAAWQPYNYVDLIMAYCGNSMARCRYGFDRMTVSIGCQKGRAVIKSRWSNVITCNRITRKSSNWLDMPSPKYLNVYEKFVRMFSVDTVLDPFLGSGTTVIAARKLGRKSIGIEISEKYCEIAIKRLAQSVMSLGV